MPAVKLASRYAKSVLDLAEERGELDVIYKDMRQIQTNLKEGNDLRLFFKSPIINPSKKLKIVDALYQGKINELTYNFLNIIIKKRREPFLVDIVDSFVSQYESKKGILNAKVTTAVEIDDAMKEKIKAFVKKKITNAENIVLVTEIDESLIGGFVLKYEDVLYDCSVSKKLQDLRKGFAVNKYVREF